MLTHFFYLKNDVVCRGYLYFLLKGNFVKLIKLITVLLILAISIPSFSQGVSPTAQQLEQFKKLPKSQQKMLAKKYGIDIDALDNSKDIDEEEDASQSVFSRDLDSSKEENKTEEDKFKPELEEIRPFGYDLFSGEPTGFSPSENALVPDSYIVGAGDVFTINLFGKETSNNEVKVDREGRLSIDKLQPITVSGLQYRELVELIKTKVEKEMIGVKAFVSMGKTRTIRIMVLGESYKPGMYTLPALSSISHALFASGGISDIGSLRNVQLKRAGKNIRTLDLYDLLVRGDSSDDVILKPGDVVFIPPVGMQVTIKGEVRRPAIFELKKSETLEELIAMAGGYKPAAFPEKTIIERYAGDNFKTILQINLQSPKVKYRAKNGDVIKVPASSEEINDAVTLLGAVTYPGNYSWKSGDRVSRLFSSIKSDLLPIADYEYALILREKNLKGDIEVHQFSPIAAIKNNTNNLELMARDKIIIFSRYQSKEKESEAFSTMALTEAQIELRERIKLWDEFKEKKFYEFIDLGSSLDKELAESLAKKEIEKAENANIVNFLSDSNDVLKEDDYAIFSREKLLKPILAKLAQQASRLDLIQVFGISGEVKFPGVYPKSVNSTIKNAIAAAGGLRESAYLGDSEVTRFKNADSSEIEHINISLGEELKLSDNKSFKLHSKDSINIYPMPNWQRDLKVEIRGEVKFPGEYTIRKGESLSDVIARAGGFTAFSYPEGAIFTREALKFQQQQQLNKLSEDLRRDIAAKSFNSSITDSSLSYQDMNSLINDLANVRAVGRLVIDLPNIISSNKDIALENNDVLYIPSKQNSVNVVGEVNFGSSHIYDSSLSVDEYIARSGGFKRRADEDRIYIIKASGLVKIPSEGSWFGTSRDEILEPGDTIVVPLNTEHVDNLTLWSTATQILYQMGVAVAAIGSL